jgi:hypothetical protein
MVSRDDKRPPAEQWVAVPHELIRDVTLPPSDRALYMTLSALGPATIDTVKVAARQGRASVRSSLERLVNAGWADCTPAVREGGRWTAAVYTARADRRRDTPQDGASVAETTRAD